MGEDELGKGSLIQEVKIKAGEKAESHYYEKQKEVFYFLTDNGYFVINGEKIDVNVGDILMVEPGDKHKTINNSDKDFIYLCFKINFVENDLIWD